MCIRDRVNYDHPDSLDVDLFIEDIRMLRRGFDISSPVYDFATHTRSDKITEISPSEVILIDGILLLAFSEICDLLDLKLFVSAPEDIRLERRILRDVAERGRTAQQAHTQFLETVQPMHAQFVEPSKENADLILDGVGDINKMAKTVESEIANSLTNVQKNNTDVEIGSYPFFRLGKIGVSVVIRSSKKNNLQSCHKDIIRVIKNKKINIIKGV